MSFFSERPTSLGLPARGGHLGRLHSNLLDLDDRLREAVAQAIGQAAAGVVGQVVLSLLGEADSGPTLLSPELMAPPCHRTGRSSFPECVAFRGASARAVRVAGWGHRGKPRRSRTWPARRADEPLSVKRPCHGAHGSAASLVAGQVGRASDSLGVFLIALVVLLVAGHHAGDVRR
jgi:hypothetical protein